MSLVNDLKAVQPQTPPAAGPSTIPPLGVAPVTQEESNALRQAQAMEEEKKAINQMRVEQLSGAIFTRLSAAPDVLNAVASLDKEKGTIQLNSQLLDAYLSLCNHIAAQAAIAHASKVWGVPCAVNPANSAAAVAQPAQPATA